MASLVGQLKDFYDTTGGIDTISSSIQLGNTKLRDAQNINYFPVGGYSSRNGYTALNTVPVGTSAVNGLYMARFSGATNVALLVSGGKIYTINLSGGATTDITNGQTIASGNQKPIVFDILNDIVVMCDDTNTTLQTTSAGTTAVLGGSPVFTSALFCVAYRGYMFYGQTVESATRQYDRLRFSDINLPNSFTMLGSNNFIDVAKKAGGDVRGAVDYNTYLYVFKRNGIYQINYQPTRVNSSGVTFPFIEVPNPVVPNVGTQSHKSIVKFTTPITNKRQSGVELVFFVDQFGIPRIFDGRTTVQIGYPISQSRDTSITSLTNMDRSQLPYVWAVNYPERNQILCFMSKTNSKMDTCWVFDYTVDFTWGRHSFANTFASGALFEKSDGTWRVYLGDYAGTSYLYDTGTTDNNVAISYYATHGDVFNQSPAINSKWPWLELKGTTSSVTNGVNVDFYKNSQDTSAKTISNITLQAVQTTWGTTGSGGTMTWGVSSWAKSGLQNTQKEYGDEAKTLRTKISGTTANTTLILEGFTLNTIPEGISQV